MVERGTKPRSSMISRLSRDSCFCKFSRRLSSLASIISYTKPAAVVKPTDIPFLAGGQAQPQSAVASNCQNGGYPLEKTTKEENTMTGDKQQLLDNA